MRPSPCVYACLVSLSPPAEPYKPKGTNTMLGAFLFCEVDWKQTTPHHFIFAHTEDIQVSGKVFKPTLATSLLFDFKRLDLKTGVMEDFGFALQYLVHNLKDNLFLIGGQY